MQAKQEIPKMKVKITHNDDTRLWRYNSMDDFQGLMSFISSTWSPQDFIAQYEDEEGDKITIASAQDLRDAFTFARAEQKKSLKIFVQSKAPASKDSKVSAPQDNNNNDDNELNDDDPEKASGIGGGSPMSMPEMVTDFIANGAIQKLVPEFFGAVVDKLMRGGDTNVSVEQITGLLYTELADVKYAPITSHPLYVAYGMQVLPYIANRIHAQQNLYPHFKLRTIKNWIVQLIGMLRQHVPRLLQAAANGKKKCCLKDIVIDIEYPAKTDTGKVIHFGVECNLCGEYPIIGDRYKCSICEDWDCCTRCEPKHDHPLIKFKQSSKQHQNASFKGLSEIAQRLSSGGAELKNNDEDEDVEDEAEGVDEDDVAQALESWCDCICGGKTQCVIARCAYPRTMQVCCDGCSAQLVNEMVYHCPKGYDAVHHPHGYDLCGGCAQLKIRTDKLRQRQQNDDDQQQQPQKEVEQVEVDVQQVVDADADVDVKPDDKQQENVDAAPSQSPAADFVNVVANEIENENEIELKNEEVVENVPDAEPVPAPEPVVEQQPEQEKVVVSFVFAQQLQQIKTLMNFGDDKDEVLKQLLVKYQGDASRVVNALFAV
mmetsp:Transcript_36216/g.59489  ORF Transcript_36216/g.59489 Transcript_36216/m.59489 type:complete len:600 (+) Transcript_36216:103-1902(+)